MTMGGSPTTNPNFVPSSNIGRNRFFDPCGFDSLPSFIAEISVEVTKNVLPELGPDCCFGLYGMRSTFGAKNAAAAAGAEQQSAIITPTSLRLRPR